MKLIPDFTSPATYIPTGVVTIALAFMIMALLKRAHQIKQFIDILSEFAWDSSQARAQLSNQRLFLVIVGITTLFATLSIVHFLLTALVEKNSSTKRASYGIFTVMFLSFYGLYLYFSTDLPKNAPNKALDQMTCLLSAVFFLYETRLSLGREKWRPYIAFGFISSFAGMYASLPAIILYFAKGAVISSSIYESALTFSLSVFILSRILLTGELIEDIPSATVEALLQFADARDGTLNPIANNAKIIDISGETLTEAESQDGNQITIEDVSVYADDEIPLTLNVTDSEDAKTLESDSENSTDSVSLEEEK